MPHFSLDYMNREPEANNKLTRVYPEIMKPRAKYATPFRYGFITMRKGARFHYTTTGPGASCDSKDSSNRAFR